MTVAPGDNWLLIGNGQNRRSHYFIEALQQQNVVPVVVGYADLLATNDIFDLLLRRLKVRAGAVLHVKIDTPGENFAVEKQLIRLAVTQRQGAEEGRLSTSQLDALQFDRGRFAYVMEWADGFKRFLDKLSQGLNQFAHHQQIQLHYLNSPEVIGQMLDKFNCQQQLHQAGVKTPQMLAANDTFEQLIAQMQAQKLSQVFVKSRYGSSACGVMALRIKPGTRTMIAYTTLTLTGYNSLKIGKFHNENDIKKLFELIMAEQGYVERWLP
ncbi:MAG: STM4014 family protein, partial [Psychrosphaera sp.]|nr:STM4014 family protein [Psychrosphaera sp.]